MCHLYLLYSARSLGLGNQFHKDTGLISAAVHIMRRALLLSSAELPARGHEQINRDVTQLPHSPAPQWTQRWEGDVVRGVQRAKHPARERLRPLEGASCYAQPSEFHHQCLCLLNISEAPISSLSRVGACGCVHVCMRWGCYEADTPCWLSPSILCRPLWTNHNSINHLSCLLTLQAAPFPTSPLLG